MQHRGTARRRVATVTAETELPLTSEPGTEFNIRAGDKSVGSLGTISGTSALAIVRTDRVADALAQDIALTVEGIPVTLTLPGWAGLSFNNGDPNTPDA